MNPEIITVWEGERISLCASAEATTAVHVFADGDKLRLQDLDAIGKIDCPRIRDLVRSPFMPKRWSWAKRVVLAEGEVVQFTTYRHRFREHLRVKLEEGMFVLSGDADVVARIESGNISRLLGLVDDRVL